MAAHLLMVCWIRPIAAQVSGTVTAGAGTIRYGGGTTASLATLSPSLEWLGPDALVNVAVAAAALPHADWAFQGTSELIFTSPTIAGAWRVGGEVASSATAVTGGDRTGALGVLGELSYRGATWGVAAGGGSAAGWITGAENVIAPQVRLRAWWQGADLRLSETAEPTRLLGSWYTDFTTAATLHRGSVGLTVTAQARASRGWGSSAAGSVVGDIALSPQIGLEIAGGSALAEPLQSFPRTGFFNVGLRLFFPARPSPRALADAANALAHAGADGVVRVVFRLSGDSVAIVGDWNDWTPEALEPVTVGVWRLARRLPPGVYRFSLIASPEGRWVLPQGYATVPDDWGSRVAVLVVQ